MKIFSPLGVACIAVESIFRDLLENGKIKAKHVNRPLRGSRGRAIENENIFSDGRRIRSDQIDIT
jgi:hypothetical protein